MADHGQVEYGGRLPLFFSLSSDFFDRFFASQNLVAESVGHAFSKRDFALW